MTNYEEINYTITDTDEDGDAIISFEYAGHTWTMPIDNDQPISADDDGSAILDYRVIMEIDEKNQTLCIEK